MYDAADKFARVFFRKLDFVQQCYKNPNCLGLLKDYADEHQEVLNFYGDIEEAVLEVTTDDNSSSSSRSSSIVSSSAKNPAKLYERTRLIPCKSVAIRAFFLL